MAEPATINELGTIGKNDSVPKSMLATADAARSVLSGLVQGDYEASVLRTRIQRKIDGAPMFSDAQMQEANQGYRSRANWGGARAKIRDYLTAFHDLIASPDTLPKVKTTIGDERLRHAHSQIMSEEYHRALFATYPDWNFLYEMELHHKQLAIHGIGPCYWRDEKDWRFNALKRRNILVPKESPSDVSRIPIVFIRDWMYVTEIYGHIRGQGKRGTQSADSRWNFDPCMQAIKDAQQINRDTFSFEQAEERWQNNSYGWAITESKVVMVAHAFVKEYNGKVSHHIFVEGNVSGQNLKKPEDGNSGYLYSKIGAYDGVGEAVWVCFQDVGNGDFESVRGLGLEAYYFAEAQDRFNNSMLDNAMQASATLWQSETPEIAEKLTRIEIGPNRVIPSGLNIVQQSAGAAVGATMQVAQYIDNQSTTQTGSYRSRATGPSGSSRTATEVEAEVGETSKLTNASVSHYCGQADRLLEETFRRLTSETILPSDGGGEAAEEFKARCILRGIPEEYFYEICKTAKVTMCRPIGNGSYADRVSRLKNISQFMGEMPQRKRALFIRDYIAYVGGSRDLADLYGPDIEESEPGIEKTLAILENNGFSMDGLQDPFSPDNAHEVHFPVHLEFGASLLQGEPEKNAPILERLGPHMYEHLEALKANPLRKQEYAQFSEQFGEFMRMADKFMREAQMMGPQGEMGQIDAKTQVAKYEVDKKHEVDMYKAQNKAELSAQRQQFNQVLQATQTQHNIANSRATTASSILQTTAKTGADIRAKQAKEKA